MMQGIIGEIPGIQEFFLFFGKGVGVMFICSKATLRKKTYQRILMQISG